MNHSLTRAELITHEDSLRFLTWEPCITRSAQSRQDKAIPCGSKICTKRIKAREPLDRTRCTSPGHVFREIFMYILYLFIYCIYPFIYLCICLFRCIWRCAFVFVYTCHIVMIVYIYMHIYWDLHSHTVSYFTWTYMNAPMTTNVNEDE